MTAVFPLQADPAPADHDHYVLRILSALARDPHRIVVRWRTLTMTGHLLTSAIVRTSAMLRRFGVGPGTTVAVLTEANHPALLTARYAAHLLDAAVVHIRSINPRSDALMLPEDTQSTILRDTNAKVLLVDDAHLDRATSLSRAVPGHPRVVRLDVSTEDVGPAGFLDHMPAGRAVIGFTSGSTGQPKLVDQSFRMWHNMVSRLAASIDPGQPASMLAVTPLSHTAGPMLDAVLSRGGSVVLHENFDASEVLRAFRTLRITDVYLAVPHLYRLVDHPDISRTDLSSLRRVVYSGSPASPQRIAKAFRVFGAAINQVYGTTEAGGIASLNPLDHWERELLPTVGRPFPWVDVRISDPKTGQEVPRGEVGEVWVRSETTMDGYLGDPKLTAEVLHGGWLRTGDTGRWDRYGCLRLVGRVGHVINSGGIKVYPSSVEQALLTHPSVTNAAVYAIRDLDGVEYPHAAVELHDGAACAPEQLRDHVARTLSPLHAPVAFTVWDRFPLDAAGRPDRACLRSHPVTAFVTPAVGRPLE